MTQTNDILQAVPDALTEEPISFTLDILPRNKWHKWAQENKYLNKYFPKKKEYTIRPITYGNLQRISKMLVSVDLAGIEGRTLNDVGIDLLSKHSATVARIIAVAITNSRSNPPESLVNEILYNLTARESFQLLMIVLRQMDIQNFITTMIFSKGLRLNSEGKKPDEKS